MNSSPPTVSVLMAVYNTDRFLKQAIESILNQTFTDFEFLIIDDGSTDRSGQILETYAARDARIRLMRRENRGIAKTRNELLQQAQGELIAVMDSDDVALPERFERQVRFLRQHSEVLVVGTAYDRIDAKGRFLDHCDPPQTDAEIQALLITGASLLHHPSALLRRSALLAAGGYRETMVGASDLDLWLRLGELGQLANLPDTLMHYRLHPGSLTYRKQMRQTRDAQSACERAWERRGIQGEFTRGAIDSLNQHEFMLRWGWAGFMRGDRRMAIDYGLLAVQQQVMNPESWRLLVCALIKPMPTNTDQSDPLEPLAASRPADSAAIDRVPAVSVLMAVYNSERYVGQAVESILHQTFTDFELIILDDGSTDRSLPILQQYAAQDDRIRLVSRENQGIPRTRNELLSLARGELIAIMDSDDIALPDRLANQVAYLQQHPEVLWLGGAFELIDAQGRKITQIPLPEDDRTIKNLLRQGYTSMMHPTTMVRRSAVLQVGGYDESLPLAEDLDLWLRLAEKGALANLPQPVVQYRLHGNSICNRHQGLPPQEIQTALDRAWQKGLIAQQPQATIVCAWRPEPNPTSHYLFLLKYGWWAFNYGQRNTALFYGTRAIVQKPWSLESWRLLICAILKPLPQPECP